jgi:hypothetical protein
VLFRGWISSDGDGRHRPALGHEPWRGLRVFPEQGRNHRSARDDRHEGEAILNSTAQRIEDPIEGLRELVRAYANGLIDPAGSQRRRVAVHGWAEALQNPRVHARIVEGINVPRSLIVGLVEQAQRIGRLSNDLSADAVARCFVALFQGFVLQAVWGEDVDVESCVAALDRMLQGLANSNPQPTRRR